MGFSVARLHGIALGAFAFLAACGGGGSPAVPSGNGLNWTPDVAAHRKYAGNVFVSDPDNDTVWVCPATLNDIRRGFGSPTQQLQGVSDPVQIAVDAQGTIYVANAQVNAAGGGSITEYPRGATSPSRTLTSGLNTSTGVAVDSLGNVYVSNKYLASILVFGKGKNSPKKTIKSNLRGPDGLAVDTADNLYIADSTANDVLKLAHGSTMPQSLHLKSLSRPIGVAVDAKGDLYVSNLLAQSSNVTVYAPGKTTPKATIVVPGPAYGSENTIAEPMMLSITHPGDVLIVSAPISLALIGGKEWFGYNPAAVGFAAGQTQPLWSNYDNAANDAVFQPAN